MAIPVRPGAGPVRPSGPPSRGTGTNMAARQQQSVAELNALPEFVEGPDVDLDPSNVGDGNIGSGDGTLVQIIGARFGRFTYKGREDIAPEVRLFLSLKRVGDAREAREESFKYGPVTKFAISPDGNKVRLATGLTYVPKPYKFDKAIMLLASLKQAGFSIEKLNSEGAKALVGLVAHVRFQKVAGQNPDAKPSLMVDFLEGVAPINDAGPAGQAPTAPSAPTAPAKEAAKTAAVGAPSTDASASMETMATEALTDVLANAEGNTIARSSILTVVIGIDKYKNLETKVRGALLKVLRDDTFLAKQTSWKVDGVNISLA